MLSRKNGLWQNRRYRFQSSIIFKRRKWCVGKKEEKCLLKKYFWEEGRTSVWLSFGKSADGGGYHALQTAACRLAHIFCPLLVPHLTFVAASLHLIEISSCSCFRFAAFGKLQICWSLKHFALLRGGKASADNSISHLLHQAPRLASLKPRFWVNEAVKTAWHCKYCTIVKVWYFKLDL